MLLQPPVLAILLIALIQIVVAVATVPFSVAIARRWDLANASEVQVRLERRTRLVSTLIAFVMALQVVGLPLLVFTADRLAAQIAGAMCAVGTLNANAYGFRAFALEIVAFFGAVAWLVLDTIDASVATYPLTRAKYLAALMLAPLLAVAGWTKAMFLAALEPSVITSCCARVFVPQVGSVAGTMAAIPATAGQVVFFAGLVVATMASLYVATGRRGRASAALAGGAGLIAFVTSVAGIISFLAPAVYEDVLHHCPFCILKAEYTWQGYVLYVPLFAAAAGSTGLLCASFAAGFGDLRVTLPGAQRRWAAVAAAGFLLVIIAGAMILARSHVSFR